MCKSSKSTFDQRVELYGSWSFRFELTQVLGADLSTIVTCLDALLSAGKLPCVSDETGALMAAAIDAAMIIVGLSGQQAEPRSPIRAASKAFSMPFQCKTGPRPRLRSVQDASPLPHSEFGMELADVFKDQWAAGNGSALSVDVTIGWNGARKPDLYGIVNYNDQAATTSIYSTAPFNEAAIAQKMPTVQITLVGGQITSAASLSSFADTMKIVAE